MNARLPEKLFGGVINPQLVAQAIRVYLANQRRANAKTKTRGEVRMTTAKMYKQKGTGRARHGAHSAPQFVGGGIAFGPTGTQNYHLEMSGKMRRGALISALSEKAREKTVVILKIAEKGEAKTKTSAEQRQEMKLTGKVLVVAGSKQESVKRSWRNLEGVQVVTPEAINPFVISANRWLALTEEALEEAKKLYAN